MTGGASRANKLATALSHKADANAAFISGDLTAALKSYHLAVLYLSGLESRSILGLMGENSAKHGQPEDLSSDSSSDDNDDNDGSTSAGAADGVASEEKLLQQAAHELSLVHSNMAACYLKQTQYAKAIAAADKAIKNDSNNLKAKFRKAQAMRLGGDVYKAQTFLKHTIEALNTKPTGKGKGKAKDAGAVLAEFQRELGAVDKTIAAKEAAGRNVWKGFLGKTQPAQPSSTH